jgi:3',5'-cyclic AMP phosphodiesterase CpdA
MITKIAHITDLHLDDKISGDFIINARLNTSRIIDSIVKEKIKHVIITGVLGLSTSFEWLKNELYKRELVVYYAMGNHDDIAIFKNMEEYINTLIKNKLIYTIEINCSPPARLSPLRKSDVPLFAKI